jgi:hypothetical protein
MQKIFSKIFNPERQTKNDFLTDHKQKFSKALLNFELINTKK